MSIKDVRSQEVYQISVIFQAKFYISRQVFQVKFISQLLRDNFINVTIS